VLSQTGLQSREPATRVLLRIPLRHYITQGAAIQDDGLQVVFNGRRCRLCGGGWFLANGLDCNMAIDTPLSHLNLATVSSTTVSQRVSDGDTNEPHMRYLTPRSLDRQSIIHHYTLHTALPAVKPFLLALTPYWSRTLALPASGFHTRRATRLTRRCGRTDRPISRFSPCSTREH
jgi:hypothetical protein